jgi:predicted PurR-regulated permease PerM
VTDESALAQTPASPLETGSARAPFHAPPKIRAALDHPIRTPFVATLAVMAAIVLGLAVGSLAWIVVSIVLAMFLALGLNPVVLALQRAGLKRGTGIAIVFAAFLILVVIAVVFLLPAVVSQFAAFAESLPSSLEELTQTAWFLSLDPSVAALVTDGIGQVAAFFAEPRNIVVLFGGLLALSVGVIEAISSSIIVVVLTLYFLGSLDAMKSTLYRLTASHSRSTVETLTERTTDSVGAYVLGEVILAACNAAVVVGLYLVLGLPYVALMGAVAFVVTLVPVIGSVAFLVIGSVVALFADPTDALLFAVMYLIYIQVEAYVVTPRVMSRAAEIPGVLVILGALIGGALMGFLGALVAIPITAAILLIIKHVVIPLQDSKTIADN